MSLSFSLKHLFSLNRFMTFEHRYTIVVVIHPSVLVVTRIGFISINLFMTFKHQCTILLFLFLHCLHVCRECSK